jgi:hypothetical protein
MGRPTNRQVVFGEAKDEERRENQEKVFITALKY